MSELTVTIGKILHDMETDKRYRVIAITQGEVVLCEMDTTKLKLTTYLSDTVMKFVIDGSMVVEEDEGPVFEDGNLPEKVKEDYENKRQMMNDVREAFGPTYLGLVVGKRKDQGDKVQKEEEIRKRYGVSPALFRRACRKYLQSGMRDSSLVDGRFFAETDVKPYQYSKKPGRKSKNFKKVGIALTDEDRANMDKGIEHYKKQRDMSVRDAYLWMSRTYYRRPGFGEGSLEPILLPEDERPTLRQFEYYLSKQMSKEEKQIRKTSAQEARNDHRLLLSDVRSGVNGPGDLAEIDEQELDLSMVSLVDHGQTVGRAILYLIIDVYSGICLGASISYQNNSVMGVTNLLLNLAEDKQEYCKRYGVTLEDPRDWPSNVLPERIQVDRGSEYKSTEFKRICRELNVEVQNLPGGTGSLKSLIEQRFKQINFTQSEHLENHGLIEKRHDSQHHKEATLDIEQYIPMLIDSIIRFNHRYMEDYPRRRDMREKGVQPVPVDLWDYGVKYINTPRPITDIKRYYWTLMTPVTAKLSRKGIFYHGLWYISPDDDKLDGEMRDLEQKTADFEVRIDRRCIDNVYYMRDHEIVRAPLNPNKTGNLDYKGCTFAFWDRIWEEKKKEDAIGRVRNEELDAYYQEVDENIVKAAVKNAAAGPNNTKGIRQAQDVDKQLVDASKRIEFDPSEESEIETIKKPDDDEDIIDMDPFLEEEEWEEFDKAFEIFKEHPRDAGDQDDRATDNHSTNK